MSNTLSFELYQYYGNMLLARLKKALVFSGIVNTSFVGPPASAGAIINVPFVNFSGTVRERSKGGAVTIDDLSNGNVQMTMTQLYSGVALDTLDMAFENVDLMNRAVEEVAQTIIEGVNAKVAALWNKIPYEVGEVDSSDAFNATDKLTHLSSARKKLMDNKSPMAPLYGVINTQEAHNLRILDIFTKVNEAGSGGPRFEGDLGKVYNINLLETQQVESAVLSQTAAWGTPLIDLVAGYAIGDTTIHVDGVGSGATIKKGSTFSLGGYSYVVTADALASTQDIDLVIFPPLRAAAADDDPLTPLLHTSSTATSQNLVFHPSALGLAVRPLPQFIDGAGVKQITITDPETGLSVNLAIQASAIGGAGVAYTQSMVASVICGSAVLRPECAVRITGKA